MKITDSSCKCYYLFDFFIENILACACKWKKTAVETMKRQYKVMMVDRKSFKEIQKEICKAVPDFENKKS